MLIKLAVEGPEAILTIDDSAPGVSPQDLAKLFDPLFRVENSRNRQMGGSGLGLGICERIAKAHGGKIKAEPSNLGGLKVRLSLPLDTSNL